MDNPNEKPLYLINLEDVSPSLKTLIEQFAAYDVQGRISLFDVRRFTLAAGAETTLQFDSQPLWFMIQNLTGGELDISLSNGYSSGSAFRQTEVRWQYVPNKGNAISFRNNSASEITAVVAGTNRL